MRPVRPVERTPQPPQIQHMLHLPQPQQTLRMSHRFNLTHHAHHTQHHHETLTLQRLWPANGCRFHLKLFLEGSWHGPLQELRLSYLFPAACGAVGSLEDRLIITTPTASCNAHQRHTTPHSALQRPSKLPDGQCLCRPFFQSPTFA